MLSKRRKLLNENFDYESFKAKYVDKKRRTFLEYIDDKLEKMTKNISSKI